MTVQELTLRLSAMPDDAEVRINKRGGDSSIFNFKKVVGVVTATGYKDTLDGAYLLYE